MPTQVAEGKQAVFAAVAYGGAYLSLRVLGFAIIPVVTRHVTVEEFARFGLLGALLSLAYHASELGTGSAAVRLATDAETPEQRAKVFASLLWGRFAIAGVVSVLACALITALRSQLDRPLTLALYLTVLAYAISLNAHTALHVARAQVRHRISSTLVFVQSLVWAGATLLFTVPFQGGLVGLMAAQALGAGVALLTGIALVGPRSFAGRPSTAAFLKQLSFGAPLGASKLIAAIYGMDRYLVRQLTSLRAAGLYHLATLPMDLVAMVEQAGTMATEPYVYGAKGGQAATRLGSVMRLLGFAVVLPASWLVLLAGEVLALLGPPAYAAALPVVPWLSACALLGVLLRLSGLGAAYAYRTRIVLRASLVDLAVAATAALLLAPRLGIVGVAAGRTAGALCGAIVCYLSVRRALDAPLPFFRVLAAAALSLTAAAYASTPWIAAPWGLAPRVALGVGLSLALVAWLLGPPREVIRVVRQVLRRANPTTEAEPRTRDS